MVEPKTQYQAKRSIAKMLTSKEQGLIDTLREIPYGRIVIYLENGEPVRMEEALKSKKF